MEPEGSITYNLLLEITDHFSDDRLIGEGAFGRVYKGVMKNGEDIAVKLLSCTDPGLDDELFNKEFCNLIRFKHPNIVKFLGYCYETSQVIQEYEGRNVCCERTERALCFEYLDNGSLDRYICDESSGLDWNTRYRIIWGTCEGLKYLHQAERPTYHLDLKPGNILLDVNMMPKLADFGLSRIFLGQNHIWTTHHNFGTLGYCPPEYINDGEISVKFDIFSLGVVMLKIVSGPEGYTRSASMPHEEFITSVQNNWRKRLEIQFSGFLLEAYCKQIKMCTKIALTSTDYDRNRRPPINAIMVQLIESEASILNLEMGLQGKSKAIEKDKAMPSTLTELSDEIARLKIQLELSKSVEQTMVANHTATLGAQKTENEQLKVSLEQQRQSNDALEEKEAEARKKIKELLKKIEKDREAHNVALTKAWSDENNIRNILLDQHLASKVAVNYICPEEVGSNDMPSPAHLKAIPGRVQEHVRSVAMTASSQALAIVKALYPTVDIEAVSGGFPKEMSDAECHALADEVSKTAAELMKGINIDPQPPEPEQ